MSEKTEITFMQTRLIRLASEEWHLSVEQIIYLFKEADVFGYRTSMSMKNKDTWEFAHKYCGKVWYVCGMVMLPITVIFMLLVIGKNEDCVGSMGGIICGVQLIPLIGSILPTEIALKKNFDKNGTRR